MEHQASLDQKDLDLITDVAWYYNAQYHESEWRKYVQAQRLEQPK